MKLANTKDGAGRMTLRLDALTMKRLNDCHTLTDIPKTRIINRALNRYLDELEEDLEDARTGEAAWAEFLAGDRKTYTLEEMREMHGL